MKLRKPKGRKYRNLFWRGKVVWIERVVDERRYQFSSETDDWDEAVEIRDRWEAGMLLGQDLRPHADVPKAKVPTVAEFLPRYLEEDLVHLKPSTQKDRRSSWREDGPLLSVFGDCRLDEIRPADVRRWWTQEIDAKGRSRSTGRNHLSALSGLLDHARSLEIVGADVDPVKQFRAQHLRKISRTSDGRAEAAPKVNPITDTKKLDRLVAEAEKEGLQTLVVVLLLLDAGLRLGEAHGLAFDAIDWGTGENDEGRCLRIYQSRPQGRAIQRTKSGRERSVHLSRRLGRALRRLQAQRKAEALEAGEPWAEDGLVLQGFDPGNFRRGPWARITKRAKLTGHSPKDLRDSFASWLLSLGIPLSYVSDQLGHADVAVTAKHYARWCGGSRYRRPVVPELGEVPQDLIARLGDVSVPTSVPTIAWS